MFEGPGNSSAPLRGLAQRPRQRRNAGGNIPARIFLSFKERRFAIADRNSQAASRGKLGRRLQIAAP
jgi:hypothetical protein